MRWYVFSDMLFMADVVNGLAAITANVGGGAMDDYTGLLKIVTLIGVMAMFVQGMTAGGALPIGRFLMVPLFFVMMAGPKVTVTMENVYSGATRTIANVPYGIALTGELFSFAGMRITEIVETAYSYPGVTDDGLNRALDNWRTLRRIAGDTSLYAGANNAGGGDFARSWVQYISTCTAFGLDVGNLAQTDITRGNLAHMAVYNPSRSFGAEIFVGGGTASQFDCVEAHARLLQYSRLTFLPALRSSVLAYHFYDPVRDGTGAGPSTPSWALVQPRLQSMFTLLGGLGSVALDEAILSIFVGSLYDHGAMRRLQLDRKDAYAVMVGDAIRARNAQWMAQGDVFQQYVTPLLSFIEGFWYALFPVTIMGLLLGARGLQVVGRYLQIGLWIQLWAPCLAVVNLYVYHAVTNDLASLDQAALTLTSLGGQFAADSAVQKYLGVAGLFASAGPTLALLLVTGSIYTMNTVAASVGGPDTVTETNAAPARQALSPAIQVLPTYEDSPMHGLMRTGAPQAMPTINLSQMAESRVASARSEMAGERVSFAQAIDRSLSQTSGSSRESFSGSLWRDGTAAQQSDVFAHTQGNSFRETQNEMRSAGLSEREAATFSARVGASVAAGRGTPNIASLTGDGGVASSWSSTRQISHQKIQQWSDDIARAYSEDEFASASLVSAFSNDNDRGWRQSGYSSSALTSSESVRREGQEYAGAEQRFETASSFAGSVGTAASPNVAMLARRIVDNPGRFREFKRMLGDNDLVPATTQRAQELHAWGWDASTVDSQRMALTAGGLLALADAGHYGELQEAIGPDGWSTSIIGDPDANRGVGASLGAGPSVSLQGRGAGGFDPGVAPGWTPEGRHADNVAAVRAEVDAEIGPIVQQQLGRDRVEAEASRADALASPSLESRVNGFLTDLVAQAAANGFGQVHREMLAHHEGIATRAGLSPAGAQYYAMLRATPNLNTAQQREMAQTLRDQVENRYSAVPEAGAAQIAEIEEAARSFGVEHQQLLSSIAARDARIEPEADPANLDMWQRNARP